MNTYDKALDILLPEYNWLAGSTFSDNEIEGILIAALIRKGATRANATRWTRRFLGE
jgi:hypothetical protein